MRIWNVNFGNLSTGAKVGVLLMVMLAIGGINVGVVYYYQSQNEKDSQVVDVAGAQRMLSQEMTKLVNAIAAGDDTVRPELEKAIATYDTALIALRNGGEVKGYDLPPAPESVIPLLDKNEELWAEFKKNADAILKEAPLNPEFTSSLEYVIANNYELMSRSNAVVDAYKGLEDKEKYTHEIDVAGRQRMLSQMLTKLALEVGQGMDEEREELREGILNFDGALKAMRDGGVVMGAMVKPAPASVAVKIKDVEELWAEFKKNAVAVQTKPRLNDKFVVAHLFIKENNLELRKLSNDVVKGFTAVAEEKNAFMRKLLVGLFFINLGVFAIGYFVARKTIGNPLKDITYEARRISGGDLTAREIRGAERGDEIGQLSRAFNEMISNLRDLVSGAQSSAHRVAAASQELAASSEEMTATTSQVSSTVQQIATGAQNQSRLVETASEEMRRMAERVQQVAEKSQAAAGISMKTDEIAKAGGEAAKEAANKMREIHVVVNDSAMVVKELGERSKRIGEMVNLITSIAEQTNLLALNAAIEAARAGEHGRGFAVVAEEVRKLAESSAKAAEEIRELVEDIQGETDKAVESMDKGAREVDSGTEIVNKALEYLEEIVEAVKETVANVQEITSATQEQFALTERVVKSMEEIATTAEQAAAGTEEASAAAEEQSASMEQISSSAQELSSLALQLQEATRRFRLNGEAVPQSQQAEPGAYLPPAPSAEPVSEPREVLKPASGNGDPWADAPRAETAAINGGKRKNSGLKNEDEDGNGKRRP